LGSEVAVQQALTLPTASLIHTHSTYVGQLYIINCNILLSTMDIEVSVLITGFAPSKNTHMRVHILYYTLLQPL